VLVPAGTYRCGHLKLASNINLHLDDGSRLVAVHDPAAFDERPRSYFWITADDAHNLAITGAGALDGQGTAFMAEELPHGFRGMRQRPRILGLFGCQGVRIENVTLYNSADWAIHPCGCEDLVISGITIRNNLKIPNCDGIDPDHCRNVRISNCHIEAGDDGIVIKTRREWNRYGPCENITVTGCTIVSTSCGLKIGTETAQDIRNVVFSDCVVYNTNRALGIAHRDEGTVENIVYANIVVQTRLFHDMWWGKAEPIYVTSLPRAADQSPGPLRNIRFTNILARGENGVYIHGCAESMPTHILLDNVRVEMNKTSKWPGGRYDARPCPPEVQPRGGRQLGDTWPEWGCVSERRTPGFLLDTAADVTLRNCEVAWGDNRVDEFGSALESYNVRDLRLIDFRGRAAWPERDADQVTEP
jgi:hypothetical protein